MAIYIQKKQKVETQFKMVKLQILLYTFFNGIGLTDSDLDCATTLAIKGFKSSFFREVVEAGIFKSEQSARNCMSKLRGLGITIKDGKDWTLNPQISVGVDRIILLDLKAANVQ